MAAFSSVMIGLAIAGAGVSAVQRIRAGNAAAEAGEAQREAAESQAELAEYNAAIADLQAADAIERGAQDESRFRAGVRGIVGAQRAATAGSNVDVGFGSALDVQADAAFLGELDALTIRTNAAREAWGFEVEATDLRKRAEIARKEGVFLERAGREARTQSRIEAGSTLLGAGTSLLQARYGFGRE